MVCASRTVEELNLEFGPRSYWGTEDLPIQDLIDFWLLGDDSAATEIYERFVAQVRGVVRFHLNRRFHNRCDEEDAVQTAFFEAFRRLSVDRCLFDSDASFRRWIRAVTRNRTIKLIKYHNASRRAVSRETRTGDNETFRNLVDLHHKRFQQDGAHVGSSDLRERLTSLDNESREIIGMLEEMFTQEEIAHRLGCTTRTIRRRVRRIRELVDEAT